MGFEVEGSGLLEASQGGMKVGRVKDPLYKDSYLGIIPPTFTPPLEPFEFRALCFRADGLWFRL